MRRVVLTQTPFERIRRVLNLVVVAVVALRALGTVVVQPRVRVAESRLEPAREAPLQHELHGVILAFTRGDATPLDALILRPLSERLRDVAVEPRVRRLDTGRVRQI